jgi:hemolysin III
MTDPAASGSGATGHQATGHQATASDAAVRRIMRMTGTELCPRWRGWVHLGALLAAGPAAAALIVRRPSFAVVLYAVGLVVMLGVSSAYHLLPLRPAPRRTLRQVDHAMIFVFIAASYTPLCWLAMPRHIGAPVLALAWVGAVVGVVIKVVGFDRARRTGAVLYAVVGGLAVFAAPLVVRSMDAGELILLGATVAVYSAGAVVLAGRRPDPFPHSFGYHEIWHTAVVVAAACDFALVWDLAR